MDNSVLGFREIMVIIHALGAAAGLGTVLTTDYIFMKFLRDRRLTEERVRVMKHLSEVIWIALGLLLITGIYLAATQAGITESPKFVLKMAVVAVLFLNGLLLNSFLTPRLHKIAFHESHARQGDEPDHVRKIAVFAGAVSIFSWILAFVLGKLRAIPLEISEAIGIYLGIIILIAIGAGLTKKKKLGA